jgi:predicted DNA-binding transcriptional regulator AlpA
MMESSANFAGKRELGQLSQKEVNGLAAVLANSGYLEGWLLLARARITLGEHEKAKDALDKATDLLKKPACSERFMPRAETLSMAGLKSPTTLYDLIRRKDFPAPYSITLGRKGWAFSEVQQWIADRKKKGRTARLE